MKNTKRNSVIILVITILVLVYILKDNFIPIVETLKQANLLWLFVTLVLFVLYFIFDQLSLHNIIKQYSKDFKFQFSLYLGMITKFFNGITPLATGGQPMEVYEMHKKGIAYSNGTNIVIQNYIVFQIALVFYAFVAAFLDQYYHLFNYVPVLRQLTIIGFIINVVILFILFMVSFNKKFNKKIVNGIINFLYKIKILKEKNKLIEKANKICDDYYENAKTLIKNKKTFAKCIFYQIVSLGIYNLMPLFIAMSLNINDLNVISSISASAYIYVMGCYVPIPGATGGMEYAFMGYFGSFLSDAPLKALLILWRFLTYYMPTIFGALIYNLFNNTNKKDQY